MKILLAVDGSEYTGKMLDYVCAHKTLFDASHTYTLFYAQAPLPPHVRSTLGGKVTEEYYRDEAHQVLQPAQARLQDAGLNVAHEWKVGHAGETIAAFASEGRFDLLLMGTHGHGALARLVLGSVTTQVLAHCGVPVLLVR